MSKEKAEHGCFSRVNITSYSNSTNYSSYAGGLVGQNSGNIENCIAVGDVCAKKDNRYQYVSDVYAGTLFGLRSSYSSVVNNNYYYENQVVIEQLGSTFTEYTKNGAMCSKDDLENMNFYLDTLGWANDIWLLDNINIEIEKYPILIKH